MMFRCMQMAVGLGLVLSMSTRDASAQWGHGGWAWGGWDPTRKSIASESPASFAMGSGIYKYDPRLNAGLVAKFNGHVAETTWTVCQFGPPLKDQAKQNRKVYQRLLVQLRQSPTASQLENGDALNLAVADLSDPKLSGSVARAAKVPIAASVVAEVPFESASERVTFMLDRLRAAVKWPEVFPEERFADSTRTFDELVTRMQKEDQAGDISAKTLDEAQEFVNALRAKLVTQPLKDPDKQQEAMKFVSGSSALVGLLKKPDIRPAISALRKLKDTSLGNLLGFLHAFNLRFGPATTPKEREAYRQLFVILDKTRDEVMAEAKLGDGPNLEANPSDVADFFHSVEIDMRKRGYLLAPVEPKNPR